MKRAQISEGQVLHTALDRLTGADASAPSVPKPPRETMIKLSVFLNREEDAYLESLASAAKFSGGTKISKTKLVEAMVRAFSQSKLDVSGVRNDDELMFRVSAQLR
ncbi:MAG: hypothetical protein HYX79_03820 [Chloroflexi bacterium]|nr:hypothetical protein [Chloroflexota bacterium]